MTKYNVFRKRDLLDQPVGGPATSTPNGYELIGEYDGHDAKSAVKAAILEMPADKQKAATSETFAATPSASWREVSPKVETTTVVSFA